MTDYEEAQMRDLQRRRRLHGLSDGDAARLRELRAQRDAEDLAKRPWAWEAPLAEVRAELEAIRADVDALSAPAAAREGEDG